MKKVEEILRSVPQGFYVILALLVNFFFLWWKRPDAFINPQFWAEDGFIFFHDAYYSGVNVLFKPYNGYLHLYPRLIAWMVENSTLSYVYFPLMYMLSWLFPLGICIFYLFFKTKLSVFQKIILSILMTAVPVSAEVMLNLTNSQWLWSAFLVILVVSETPIGWGSWIIEILLIIIAGLSGPLSIVFPVIYFINILVEINRKDRLVSSLRLLLLFFCGAIQLYFLLFHSNRISSEFTPLSDVKYLKLIFDQYSYFIFGNIQQSFSYLFYLLGALIILSFQFFLIFKNVKDQNKTSLIFVVSGLLFFSVVMFESRSFQTVIHPFSSGMRYFYLPTLFLLFGILTFQFSGLRFYKYWSFIFFIWISFINIYCFGRYRFSDFKWKESAIKMDKGNEVFTFINPFPLFIHIKPDQHKTR